MRSTKQHVWVVEFQERPGRWIVVSGAFTSWLLKEEADRYVWKLNSADPGNYRVRKYVREES